MWAWVGGRYFPSKKSLGLSMYLSMCVSAYKYVYVCVTAHQYIVYKLTQAVAVIGTAKGQQDGVVLIMVCSVEQKCSV